MPTSNSARPVGSIETVPICEVWPNETNDFTPWLQANIVELDKVLGLGLANAESEVAAGKLSIGSESGQNLR